MVIPHSEKGITSFHLSTLDIFLVSVVFFVIVIFGTVFSFQIQDKSNDFQYYYQENLHYKKQIGRIHEVLPNITQSQNSISDKLDEILSSLGVEALDIETKKIRTQDTLPIISELDNVESKMVNIANYISNFRKLFHDIPSIFPVLSNKYWFTSPYGLRRHPITGQASFHPAIDIAAFPGTPIRATADGQVSYSGWRGGYGNVVYLEHAKGYHTRFAHMMRRVANLGDQVKKGDIIGYVGTTGVSTGYHLHYELWLNGKTINPIHYLYLDRFWR